jgi:HK97 gp10 family phage protein
MDMGNNVKITIIDNSPEVKSAFQKAVARGLEAVGLQAENNAKEEITKVVYNSPPAPSGYVRTGALRNSITHTTDADAAYVGSNIEYAPYVEYGTSKMKPRPFIKPAVQNYMDEYEEIMKNELKNG